MGIRRTKDKVKVGSVAPDFTLPSQAGEMVSLKDFSGRKPVVLFFYPKDDSPGCTKEVCAFRDNFEEFSKLDVQVIGRFAAKHDLSFPLLSDEGGNIRRLYGVPKTFGLIPGRVTYIIDKEGVVRHVFSSQLSVQRHVQEALAALRSDVSKAGA
jgi:peroxiredoxin Q/BCP